MKNRLSRFEELAEKLVEGSLSRLLEGGLHPQSVATKLARAMEDYADGNTAPDHYIVRVGPKDYEALFATEPDLTRILADHLVLVAEQAGLVLHRDPEVELVENPELERLEVLVTAVVKNHDGEYTRAFELPRPTSTPHGEPDGHTYLIVEGGRHIPLTKSVYTLGRRLDCDVVLTDPRVSRRHAQLRWRAGRYVLFDLGSTAGTTVNSYPIKEAVLEPGDVFSLGGVDIIFGVEAMEATSDSDQAPTRPWGPSGHGTEDPSSETS
jgi:hypothetical protein